MAVFISAACQHLASQYLTLNVINSMYVSTLNVFIAQTSIGLGLCQLLLFLVSLFLILLVLVQRGKGGGLTGALGGMGGQSAFGTKAGDAFTRITIITTLIWITLCMVTISRFNPPPAAKVTKQMTLMEKARALDHNTSIGAPAGAGDVPSDFKLDASAMGAGAGADDDSNVAEKQTPENTRAAGTDAVGSGSTSDGSSSEAPADGDTSAVLGTESSTAEGATETITEVVSEASGTGPVIEGTTVKGTTIEGTAVEGTTIEGTTVEGTTIEGTAVESTIEGTTIEGTTIETPVGEVTTEVPVIEVK